MCAGSSGGGSLRTRHAAFPAPRACAGHPAAEAGAGRSAQRTHTGRRRSGLREGGAGSGLLSRAGLRRPPGRASRHLHSAQAPPAISARVGDGRDTGRRSLQPVRHGRQSPVKGRPPVRTGAGRLFSEAPQRDAMAALIAAESRTCLDIPVGHALWPVLTKSGGRPQPVTRSKRGRPRQGPPRSR